MIPDWNRRAKGLQVPWPKVWYGFLGCRISLIEGLYVEMESSVESGVASLGGVCTSLLRVRGSLGASVSLGDSTFNF